MGDTAWELFHRLSYDESDHYLRNRADKGFTVIQAVILAELNGLTDPNANGDLPLIEQDPTRPNEAYFAHVDRVVERGNALGLTMALLPTWGDKFNLKWGVGPEVFTAENARVYGRWLGERYGDADVVWVLGGDRPPEEPDDFAIIDAMAAGLREVVDHRQLITYHPSGSASSSKWWHERGWLDFNLFQSGHAKRADANHRYVTRDRALAPAKPVLDGEPCYEDIPVNFKAGELGWFNDFDVRRAAWWSMLEGAAGHTYGHHAIWQMWQPGRSPILAVRTPWQQALDYPGAWQMGVMRRTLERIAWQRLQPASDRVLDGPDEPAAAVRAAVDGDGRFAVVYSPHGATFSLNLDGLQAGAIHAEWIDPRTGHAVVLPNVIRTDEAVAAFDPPADAEPGNDWVLVLQVAQTDWTLSRNRYTEQLAGFWLGSCVANWTGLITEMDRVEAPFYTDADWGQPDQPNMWGGGGLAPTIDFYLVHGDTAWGSDDDTDIEYLYQRLMERATTLPLSAEQIRDGWLAHMWSDNFNQDGENYLWVSNEIAYELMRKGHLPPATSAPEHNPDGEMIDAQLTTEFFGFFAPGHPAEALRLASLPIRTTARGEAQAAAEFYVTLYALAARVNASLPLGEQLRAMADEARAVLPPDSVVRDMYDFVRDAYLANPDKSDWESTRDALYEAYQVGGRAGYAYRQPFDGAINFGASLVSYFYGEGDFRRTIQIGVLAGWDSDNPTATWGGLLGFILGRDGIKRALGDDDLSDAYRISRTRRGFPDHTPSIDGEDTFTLMAERGLRIVDRVVTKHLGGTIDASGKFWHLPLPQTLEGR